MATLAPLPHPVDDPEQPSCTIWYIQMRLGRHDYSMARMCTYVQLLITAHDFPQPFPREMRGKLVRNVSDKARWPRVAVDQWLADFIPPDATAAMDAATLRNAADTMDTRAGNLQLIKGGKH